MNKSKTLEEMVEEARVSLLKAERDLAIKSYIIEQLTDDHGQVTETEIHFELGDLKIDIGKRRTRQTIKEADKPSKKRVAKVRVKNPRRTKVEKDVIFKDS